MNLELICRVTQIILRPRCRVSASPRTRTTTSSKRINSISPAEKTSPWRPPPRSASTLEEERKDAVRPEQELCTTDRNSERVTTMGKRQLRRRGRCSAHSRLTSLCAGRPPPPRAGNLASVERSSTIREGASSPPTMARQCPARSSSSKIKVRRQVYAPGREK